MDNRNMQDMIEYERIQLLFVLLKNQVRLYFSFNPFLNYHFIGRIRQDKNLEIKVISNPGTVICLVKKDFNYNAFFDELARYIVYNYDEFVFPI